MRAPCLQRGRAPGSSGNSEGAGTNGLSRPLDARAAAHIAQARAATAARWAFLLGGALGALRGGFPSLAAGGLAFWFLGMAAPPPDPDLDRATGRQ